MPHAFAALGIDKPFVLNQVNHMFYLIVTVFFILLLWFIHERLFQLDSQAVDSIFRLNYFRFCSFVKVNNHFQVSVLNCNVFKIHFFHQLKKAEVHNLKRTVYHNMFILSE
ncbi:unnamed protein product [Rhizopus microsporus]